MGQYNGAALNSIGFISSIPHTHTHRCEATQYKTFNRNIVDYMVSLFNFIAIYLDYYYLYWLSLRFAAFSFFFGHDDA